MKHIMEKVRNDLFAGCTLHTVLLLVFHFLTEEDILSLQKMEASVEKLEEKVLKEAPDNFNEMILRYRKRLSACMAYYKQLTNVGECMQTCRIGQDASENEAAWERYTHRTERLHNYAEEMKEHLQQILELHQTQIDIQQNRVMSILTIVTTLFMPLTLITGWYGMNFVNMPELQWKYGYLGVMAVSLILIGLELLFFKKKKML